VVGDHGTPILGVNIGKLGFLADVETERLHDAVDRLLAGDYRIESRSVLEGRIGENGTRHFALNDFVITRTLVTHMIEVEVAVDGRFLNTYWSDGLIIATATGSTAYSLSVGGPIVEPGAGVFAITPIAPHTLTVRPVIVPDASVIEIRVRSGAAYSVSADGVGQVLEDEIPISIRRADRTVNLVKFHDQEYFQTLRSKLMWGAGKRQ
jgi:NAD+ kinase